MDKVAVDFSSKVSIYIKGVALSDRDFPGSHAAGKAVWNIVNMVKTDCNKTVHASIFFLIPQRFKI